MKDSYLFLLLGTAYVPSVFSVSCMNNRMLWNLILEVLSRFLLYKDFSDDAWKLLQKFLFFGALLWSLLVKLVLPFFIFSFLVWKVITLLMMSCRWWWSNSKCSFRSHWSTHRPTSICEWQAYRWLWWSVLGSFLFYSSSFALLRSLTVIALGRFSPETSLFGDLSPSLLSLYLTLSLISDLSAAVMSGQLQKLLASSRWGDSSLPVADEVPGN